MNVAPTIAARRGLAPIQPPPTASGVSITVGGQRFGTRIVSFAPTFEKVKLVRP